MNWRYYLPSNIQNGRIEDRKRFTGGPDGRVGMQMAAVGGINRPEWESKVGPTLSISKWANIRKEKNVYEKNVETCWNSSVCANAVSVWTRTGNRTCEFPLQGDGNMAAGWNQSILKRALMTRQSVRWRARQSRHRQASVKGGGFNTFQWRFRESNTLWRSIIFVRRERGFQEAGSDLPASSRGWPVAWTGGGGCGLHTSALSEEGNW